MGTYSIAASALILPSSSRPHHTTLLPNARVIRHVDTCRDVASWRRRMGRSVSWPPISKHAIARQPDLRLSTPAVAYCSAIGYEVPAGYTR
ncbi:hypothetical protein M441DRAFT_216766 [Trichoderma asperellum CBS 433.97]|uniref:Uncharacterized protein n=1 Tax=Trichoderma asperellum (strain ATCC 204424 / CBS 433.97 / NBRC 101777) TaxID=1042311 RepID=A0A2T3ZNQ8_TRIA4|nr:hypothetical protein M441DRAFT_216766 [Trichoderma asperellum CBS 433.97]PTB46445.1 hypothetical protein M441DRAFT_216766 [Trichoderma asperellum CBS 433.97]